MDGTNSQVQTFDNERRMVPMFGGIQMEKKEWRELSKGARDGLWIFYNEQGEQNKFISYDMEPSYFRLIE